MSPIVLWTLEDWADAVAALPAHGPLPRRQVLVPNERVAHALRRTLVERKQHAALAGTRFLPLIQLAREHVADGGDALSINDVEVTPALVREAFASLTLERLNAKELAELPGWDRAFARTISELEASQVSADTLLASADAHVRDVGQVFRHVAARPERVSSAALLRKAAESLRSQADAKCTPTLVVVTGFESATEVELLRALPALTWALWAVRPLREDYLTRLQTLFGEPFVHALRTTRPTQPSSSSLAALRFAMHGARPSVLPEDGSVEVVTYAGVHEEVEAAVAWVVEQIMERGIPARDIALVSPTADAYASLLSARLGALTWPETTQSIVERGLPLVERPDGARVLALIRALREGLPREHVAPLLPWLRLQAGEDEETRDLRGLSKAWDVLNCVAWVGGERSHLARGLQWSAAWQRALMRLEAAKDTQTSDERAEQARARLQGDLTALTAAIEGLEGVLALVIEERSLAELWAGLRAYIESSLKLPPGAPPVWALLDALVTSQPAQVSAALRGASALEWLEEQLTSSQVKSARFGMPAVYIGSLQGVRGLSFRAVRVLGLVEGALPSAVREDAVLSDAARRELSPLLPTSQRRAHRQLAALDDTLRSARERLVLCAPRVSMDGGARQPAAVLLDVMGALGVAPSALEETLSERAQHTRGRERRLLDVLPVSESARLLRIAAGDRGPLTAPREITSLQALRTITKREPGAHDGLLPDVIARGAHPGLTAERPISASRLGALLSCPHRYLLENVLHFREPSGPLPSFGLAPMSFGSLLHELAETFWNQHGLEFGERKHDLPYYLELARKAATDSFDAFRPSYPFANDSIADAAREELCDQLAKFVEHDWNDGAPRRFVAVERGFGYDAPCQLDTEAGPLHVHGYIDRLDVEGDSVLVRDLKTGSSKPRKPNQPPNLDPDLQLGVYARVARELAQAWELPSSVGVAYVYLRSGDIERRWSGTDYAPLHEASGEWLATAVDILEHGAFARTADRGDCRFCKHQVICASEHKRTPQVLEQPGVPARLRSLKVKATP